MSDNICSIPGCGNGGRISRTWCMKHYQRWQAHGDPLWEPRAPADSCKVDGCDAPPKGREWCVKHYTRWLRYGDPIGKPTKPPRADPSCAAEGCARKGRLVRGLCVMHYARQKKHGEPTISLLNRAHDGACSIAGCDRPYKSKGVCDLHGQRIRATGSAQRPKDLTTSERVWPNLAEGSPPPHAPDLGPCWLWTGRTDKNGYGLVARGGRGPCLSVHRWVYEHMVDAIPSGLTIDHLCRVQGCSNPWHLDPVPASVNTKRMLQVRYS